MITCTEMTQEQISKVLNNALVNGVLRVVCEGGDVFFGAVVGVVNDEQSSLVTSVKISGGITICRDRCSGLSHWLCCDHPRACKRIIHVE
jgi:hypothetical protein